MNKGLFMLVVIAGIFIATGWSQIFSYLAPAVLQAVQFAMEYPYIVPGALCFMVILFALGTLKR